MVTRLIYYVRAVVEATALLFVQQRHVKGEIIVDHVTPPHSKENGRSIPDDCENCDSSAANNCQSRLSADNHSSTAALDAFSTVF